MTSLNFFFYNKISITYKKLSHLISQGRVMTKKNEWKMPPTGWKWSKLYLRVYFCFSDFQTGYVYLSLIHAHVKLRKQVLVNAYLWNNSKTKLKYPRNLWVADPPDRSYVLLPEIVFAILLLLLLLLIIIIIMAWIYIALFKAPKALYRSHYSFIHILTSGGKLCL